jgi:hypothetical protein
MTELRLSRRAVTRALATLPIIAVPIAGRAGAASEGDNAMNMMTTISAKADRSKWDAAMARYLAAKAESDAFDVQLQDRKAKWEAGKPSMDKINFRDGYFMGLSKEYVAHGLDVEAAWKKFVVGGSTPESRQRFEALLRPIIEFRRLDEANDRRFRMDEAFDRSEHLCSEMVDRETEVLKIPSPDAAALLWKMDVLFGAQARSADDEFTPSWAIEYAEPFFEDVRRLSALADREAA